MTYCGDRIRACKVTRIPRSRRHCTIFLKLTKCSPHPHHPHHPDPRPSKLSLAHAIQPLSTNPNTHTDVRFIRWTRYFYDGPQVQHSSYIHICCSADLFFISAEQLTALPSMLSVSCSAKHFSGMLNTFRLFQAFIFHADHLSVLPCIFLFCRVLHGIKGKCLAESKRAQHGRKMLSIAEKKRSA